MTDQQRDTALRNRAHIRVLKDEIRIIESAIGVLNTTKFEKMTEIDKLENQFVLMPLSQIEKAEITRQFPY